MAEKSWGHLALYSLFAPPFPNHQLRFLWDLLGALNRRRGELDLKLSGSVLRGIKGKKTLCLSLSLSLFCYLSELILKILIG